VLLSNKTCVLIATEMEASPLLKELTKTSNDSAPYPLFEGSNINVLITGMGFINAANATEWAITQGAKKFINAGICGCINDQLLLYQICYPSFIINLDDNIEKNKTIEIKNSENFQIGTVRDPLHGGQNRTLFQNYCDLIDMESFPIAYTLKKHQLPLRLIKCISDFCQTNGQNEIKKNLPRAALLLREAIFLAIKE